LQHVRERLLVGGHENGPETKTVVTPRETIQNCFDNELRLDLFRLGAAGLVCATKVHSERFRLADTRVPAEVINNIGYKGTP
jgi:hypothetical protein